jgi:hypothetical protein
MNDMPTSMVVYVPGVTSDASGTIKHFQQHLKSLKMEITLHAYVMIIHYPI